MDTKLLGGILLIMGTAIGGGMLALPIATSQAGFVHSSFLLFGCWAVMTLSAFLILEVNLWLPAESNMISMAKATIGGIGQIVAWLSTLLLFYSLLAAYMAGGGDFLRNLIQAIGIDIPEKAAVLLFAGLLATVVYFGIRSVDYVNRGLMFTKFGAYILLVICILPAVSITKLAGGEFRYLTSSVTVAITSFGFANIIPSLRAYFHDDVVKLRKAILIGSMIPLVCYIAWDLVIMGVIPRDGNNGLIAILNSGHSTSDFVDSLISYIGLNVVTVLTRIFTSVCLATSFLGVSLGLSDFLADGLQVAKKGKGNIIVCTATFLPPLIITLLDPGIFISALSYAGIYCVVLLVLMPALMAWWGRYRKQLAQPGSYRLKGGKPVLIGLMIVAVLMIAQGLYETL